MIDMCVTFGTEGELEDFLRDSSVAPCRDRAKRFPTLSPGTAVFGGLTEYEAAAITAAAERMGGEAGSVACMMDGR